MQYYVLYILVEGRGNFPIDMLRYDNCVPITETDAGAITSRGKKRLRRVALRMYRGTAHSSATYMRWESFGWTVLTSAYTMGDLQRKVATMYAAETKRA